MRSKKRTNGNGVFGVRSKTGKDPTARGAWGKPDPWQTAVYRFEEDWPSFNRQSLTLQQCRTTIKAACLAYGLTPPPVRQHRGRAMTRLECDDETPPSEWYISFRPDHKNTAIALHEAAHYIVDCIHGARGTQDHGPTWQGVYFFLLARADIEPLDALKADARKHGLRWHEIPPSKLALARSVPIGVQSRPST